MKTFRTWIFLSGIYLYSDQMSCSKNQSFTFAPIPTVPNVSIDALSVACSESKISINFYFDLDCGKDPTLCGYCTHWVVAVYINGSTLIEQSLCQCDCRVSRLVSPEMNPAAIFVRLHCGIHIKFRTLHQIALNVGLLHETMQDQELISNSAAVHLPCSSQDLAVPTISQDTGGSASTDPWFRDPERWRAPYLAAYQALARSAMRLNAAPSPPQPLKSPVRGPVSPDGIPGVGGGIRSLDLPVYVVNLPHREDRRAHMEGLLSDLGLPPVPPSYHTIPTEVVKLAREFSPRMHGACDFPPLASPSFLRSNSGKPHTPPISLQVFRTRGDGRLYLKQGA